MKSIVVLVPELVSRHGRLSGKGGWVHEASRLGLQNELLKTGGVQVGTVTYSLN